MFTTLLESRARRQRRPLAQAISLATHAALIAGAVLATHRVTTAAAPVPEPVQWVRYNPPYVPAPATPVTGGFAGEFSFPIAPIEVPVVLPPVDPAPPTVSIGEELPGVSSTPAPDSSDAFAVNVVERPARLVPGSASPVYPEQLRSAHVEGDVRATFVIDVSGRADMRTFRIVESSHPRFSAAVTRAVASARFSPAEIGGKPVRQWVLMPFVFSLR